MLLQDWLVSVTWVQSCSETQASEFLTILFDDNVDDAYRLEEFRKIESHQESNFKFRTMLATCSWEIVDVVFEKGNSTNCFRPSFRYLLRRVHEQMNPKEWEIVVLEKVYSVNTKGSLEILMFGFELLWRSTSFGIKCRVINAIKNRFLNSSQDVTLDNLVEEIIRFLQRITNNRISENARLQASHADLICKEEISLLTHFITHLFDCIVSTLPATTAIPLMLPSIELLRQLCENNYFNVFEKLICTPFHAFERIKRRNYHSQLSTNATSLKNLYDSDNERIHTKAFKCRKTSFPFPLPWKYTLEIYSIANTADMSNDEDEYPIPLNIPGLVSLILSMFVLPGIDTPCIIHHSYCRELLFASVTALAVDPDSRGEMKAHLFLSGFQQAFMTCGASVVSLANCFDSFATNDVFVRELAMANLGNFEVTLHMYPQDCDSYLFLGTRAVNHWLLSQRLLDLLANSKDELTRKTTYIAFRGYLGQFEEYSRLQMLFGLFENCPYMHMKVLLMDSAKDFVQIAATMLANIAAVTNNQSGADSCTLVSVVKDILHSSSDDISGGDVHSRICNHSALKLTVISSHYEKESPILAHCLQEQQEHVYCTSEVQSSLFWSPWLLWKVWLEHFSQFFLISATAEDLLETVDICISRCNVVAYIAMKLLASTTLRQHFLSYPVPATLHAHKILCEVLVTLAHFQRNKLPELTEAVAIECGHDALRSMKVQVLRSVVEFAENKLMECVCSMLALIE